MQPLLQAGARGIPLKRSAAGCLARAVHAVPPEVSSSTPRSLAKRCPSGHWPEAAVVAADLSPRETDVLPFTAQGFGNKKIATLLDVSVKTVETYKARAAEKRGLRSRAAVVRYGAWWLDGLVDQR